MTFISFAQNAEDVMLLRALKNIHEGHFIDIGANHPIEDSVTKAFYDRGWSGVNVEPVTQWYQLLTENRPRDLNLQIAVSDKNQPLEFFEVTETGLSTLDAERAAQCRQQGLDVQINQVEAWTLERLFDVAGQTDTHFLKIDVEGAEAQVIRSGAWEKHRPWIVLIESTEPNTNISEHDDWEPILLQNGYQFVWFDGINRYYLAQEHNELLSAFQYPVNVLDDYTTYREILLAKSRLDVILDHQALDDAFKAEMEKSKYAILDAVKAHENAVKAHESAVNIIHQLQVEIALIRRDPIIVFLIRFRKLRVKIRQWLKKTTKAALLKCHAIVARYPRLKHVLSRSIKRRPALHEHLRRLSGKPPSQSDHQERPLSVVLEMQPKGVRVFLAEINK